MSSDFDMNGNLLTMTNANCLARNSFQIEHYEGSDTTFPIMCKPNKCMYKQI